MRCVGFARSPAAVMASVCCNALTLPNAVAPAAGKACSESQGRDQAGREGCARKIGCT